MNQDLHFMQEAIDLARFGKSKNEVPVGAIVVCNDQIIGKGWNQPITTSDPTAHAEIIALRNAAKYFNNYRLVDTTLYVTLEPCIMCVGAMLHARIKRLVFGAYDPKTGAIKSVFNIIDQPQLNHRIDVQGGVLEQECAKLLTAFFQRKRYSQKV
jgi:tRNA(adenine34) deaminase